MRSGRRSTAQRARTPSRAHSRTLACSVILFRSAALAVAVSLSLGAPSAFADNAPAASATTAVQRQAVAKGLYELAYSPKQNAVFVASSGGFGDDAGPAQVLRLNPTTLAVETRIPLERKAFGVVLDDAHNRLYVGNTVDLSVTVVDTAQNKAVGTIQLMEKKTGKDGKAAYTHDLRELVVDSAANRLYVTGHSSQPDVSSVLFVIDTTTLKVINTIDGLGNAKAPGLALDAANKRVYTSNLLADLVVVGTDSNKVVAQHKIAAEQPMNIALDPAGKRLFVTDQGSNSCVATRPRAAAWSASIRASACWCWTAAPARNWPASRPTPARWASCWMHRASACT
jgi:DNA-binding beta-propeller fold protein YncE